jgi:hypothetical protein
MSKQQLPGQLPEDVRELAVKALTQVDGLSQAALVLYEQAGDSHLSVELTAAARHMMRRISELSDSVIYPLLNTGVHEGVYGAEDFERMKELVGE